ncbi:MAG: divalent-cation tolerance protein CutA [Lysobacter sp.]
MSVVIAYCSCPDAHSAGVLARALVDERLAACVSELPSVRSTYRWQDSVEQGEEVLLMIKTTSDRLDALGARLASLHPYELPELIAVEAVGGHAPYLDWVAQQTRVDD